MSDHYILDRDFLASARLRLQHFAVLQQQSWLLAPSVQSYVEALDTPQVADLATGNAIWALDLSDRYPQAQITGLDISDEQFPAKVEIPSNVNLSKHDLFAPTPDKYKAAFDVLHLRLTVGWIHDRDRVAMFQNVYSMLKPGGYLQWEENVGPNKDQPRAAVWIINPDGTPEPGWPSWLSCLSTPSLADAFTWLQTLPEVFKEHAMEDVQVIRPKPRKSMLPTHVQCIRWVVAEIHGALIRARVLGAQEDYETQMKSMDADLRKGISVAYGWTIAVGRKSK